MLVDETITCIPPFRYGRRIGDTWTCGDCGRLWTVESNMYDSVLPFGDYIWWTEVEQPGRWGQFWGPVRRKTYTWAPEQAAPVRSLIRRAQHVLDSYGLPHTLALVIFDENPSAALPYHGAPHLLSTALRALELLRAEGVESSAVEKALLLAGLFHDADYVPGAPDAENIERAVAFCRRYVPGELADEVERLIRLTEYPHTATTEDIAGKVLQDADLLQAAGPDADTWQTALNAEAGITPDPAFPTDAMLNTDAARVYRARGGR